MKWRGGTLSDMAAPVSAGPKSISRIRTVLCTAILVGVVAVRLSSLPKWESLTAYLVATFMTLLAIAAVLWISAILIRRPIVGRERSVAISAAAAISGVLQIFKAIFAITGHDELVFSDHALVNPPESLVYFNMPLVVVSTLDILLWLICVTLSLSVTYALKRR
ncbi:hypothetical protein [Nocardia brasiliensis]|uniref:hypothetical protein n=1 Tax=Nocardia brasiliensis TaxID=37326 RepID=UPI00245545B6|nr:hypothetical protein [Nocardia brasiliensis]